MKENVILTEVVESNLTISTYYEDIISEAQNVMKGTSFSELKTDKMAYFLDYVLRGDEVRRSCIFGTICENSAQPILCLLLLTDFFVYEMKISRTIDLTFSLSVPIRSICLSESSIVDGEHIIDFYYEKGKRILGLTYQKEPNKDLIEKFDAFYTAVHKRWKTLEGAIL